MSSWKARLAATLTAGAVMLSVSAPAMAQTAGDSQAQTAIAGDSMAVSGDSMPMSEEDCMAMCGDCMAMSEEDCVAMCGDCMAMDPGMAM